MPVHERISCNLNPGAHYQLLVDDEYVIFIYYSQLAGVWNFLLNDQSGLGGPPFVGWVSIGHIPLCKVILISRRKKRHYKKLRVEQKHSCKCSEIILNCLAQKTFELKRSEIFSDIFSNMRILCDQNMPH